jgi:hypothetical protein
MPRLACLSVVALSLVCLTAPREAAAQTIYDTQRAVEMAQLRLRLYQQVEHPADLRRVQSDLTFVEAEVASLKRLLKEYGPMDRFSTGRALVLTIESTRLSLLRAELNRDSLKQQLTAMQRWHGDRLRLLQLELAEARAGR